VARALSDSIEEMLEPKLPPIWQGVLPPAYIFYQKRAKYLESLEELKHNKEKNNGTNSY
jgi:hypothetical protein